MDKLNREMDEQLQKRVADLTAHNDETGDGKLDAADLKAQLNRIEAQREQAAGAGGIHRRSVRQSGFGIPLLILPKHNKQGRRKIPAALFVR